jgi:hypothetical protein
MAVPSRALIYLGLVSQSSGALPMAKNMDALGNLFLAIELVQTGMTELPMIAAACHLPFDTIEEIAAAHARNTEESAQCAPSPVASLCPALTAFLAGTPIDAEPAE